MVQDAPPLNFKQPGQFSKPAEKLLTYKEKFNSSDFGPPFDAERYAQIDYWLTNSAWKNSCTDAQSRRDIPFDSDHVVVEARFEMNPSPRTPEPNSSKKNSKPSQEQWCLFNDDCSRLFAEQPLCLQKFVAGILRAAETNLALVPVGKKKSYISNSTWSKIEGRNQLRRSGASAREVRQLNKEIYKRARVDRQNNLIEQFNENPNDPHKKGLWRAVKGLKRKFTPQYVQMKNAQGNHVPVAERAQAIAEYLETKHWYNDLDTGMPDNTPILENNGADANLFSIEELNAALKFSKNNKQPGPDGVQMELLKWLNLENRQCLLNLINSWWLSKKAPKELFLARVVPIFKKGDTDNAANYRPISLLSSIYKVYMVMIRQRMQNAIESHLSNTQYGFRPRRSTSHAIYVIRRIQDFAEAKGTRLSLALLDGGKAFDKVQHDKLIMALRKMGFSQHYCDIIQNCYEEPTFFVKDAFGTSQVKRRSSGIRQGCPLSPYLFVIVMSCVDFEIRMNSSRWVQNGRIPNVDFDMIYYADDTIIFLQTTGP
jgi:hypothetical protein